LLLALTLKGAKEKKASFLALNKMIIEAFFTSLTHLMGSVQKQAGQPSLAQH
jgi:hypothetical protein